MSENELEDLERRLANSMAAGLRREALRDPLWRRYSESLLRLPQNGTSSPPDGERNDRPEPSASG